MKFITVTGRVEVKPDKDPREKFWIEYRYTRADEAALVRGKGRADIQKSGNSYTYRFSFEFPSEDGSIDLWIFVATPNLSDSERIIPTLYWSSTNSTRSDGAFLFEDLTDTTKLEQTIVIYDPDTMFLDIPSLPGGFTADENTGRLHAYNGDGLIPLWSSAPGISRPSLIPGVDALASGNWVVSPFITLDTNGGYYSNFHWVEVPFYRNGVFNASSARERKTTAFIDQYGASVSSGTTAPLIFSEDGGWAVHYYLDLESPENGMRIKGGVRTGYLYIDSRASSVPSPFDSGRVYIDTNDKIAMTTGAYVRVTFNGTLNAKDTDPNPLLLEWQYEIDSVNDDWVVQGEKSVYTTYLTENTTHTVRARTRDLVKNISDWSNPDGPISFFVPPHSPENIFLEIVPQTNVAPYDLNANFTSPDRFLNDTAGSSEYRLKRYENGILNGTTSISAPADPVAPITATDAILGFRDELEYTWEYMFVDQNGDESESIKIGMTTDSRASRPDLPTYEYSHNVTVPEDVSARRRWAVVVEDVDILRNTYATVGNLVSKVYSVPNGIYKVSLSVDEIRPDTSTFPWIEYSVSVDGGVTWNRINPEQRPFDYTIPTIITYNSQLTDEQRAVSTWGKGSFVDASSVPTGVQVRIAMSRKSDSPHITPQVLRYDLKVVERKGQFNLTSPEGFAKQIKYRAPEVVKPERT